jgi:hypothetical protein
MATRTQKQAFNPAVKPVKSGDATVLMLHQISLFIASHSNRRNLLERAMPAIKKDDPPHSWRKASMGSNRAACRAGK